MNMDEWWGLVDRARAAVGDRADDRDLPDDPLPAALVDVLATLEPAEIVDFYVKMDFRGGLILLGRGVFSRAVAHPDSLAGLSTVARMSRGEGGWIGYESVSCLIPDAYGRVQGETDSLDTAVATALSGMARPEKPRGEKWNGDPEDEAQLRRRLPRLAALFLD
ncbi:DUF4240 domain-containing protein [Streptomyces brasiliscabiei]|uniref:DUF4240 domain-containing protein n=1 Tax=Streptomyces brasiliscabiei TaxID=2736302 RepID=UPI001C0FF836|nr:DUF4240 domain-containing protein [Streptomyces brasiliscabiei]